MRKNLVVVIWAAGAVLTVILYEVGPDRAARAALLAFGDLPRLLGDAIEAAGARFHTLMRALTLALFVVFLALAAVAARRGLPVRWALILVPFTFIALLHRPVAEGLPASGQRWAGAFLLAAAASAAMTRKLAGRRS